MSARIRSSVCLLCVVALAASLSTSAHASDAFEVNRARDLSIGAGSLGLGIGLWMLREHSPRRLPCKAATCGDTSDGAYRYDSRWNRWSYLPVSAAMAGAMAPSMARAFDDGTAGDVGDSSIMLVQSLGLTMALTELAKTVAPRYRPFLAHSHAANGRVNRSSPDASASYWSGHSAMAFAAATSGAIDACRGGGPLGCWGPSLALHSLALSTAAMRVLAGKHHVSDVVVGGAVGSAVATVVALTHAPKGREQGTDAMRSALGAQVVLFSFSGIF